MNNRTGWMAVLLLAVTSVVASAPAAGALCLEGTEKFRVRMAGIVADYHRAADLAEGLRPDQAEILRQAVTDLETVAGTASDEQIDWLCDYFGRHPAMAAAPRVLESALLEAPSTRTGCLRLERHEWLPIFITSQVLKVTAAGLETACKATECITAVCKVTCSLAGVANGLVLIATALLEESDYCGKSIHFELVRDFSEDTGEGFTSLSETLMNDILPPLDEPVSSRATQDGFDTLQGTVDQGLSTSEAQVQTAAADLASQGEDREGFQQLSLRQAVENNLQEGEIGRIVRFQMPAAVGGLLEEVREIVAQTILDNEAAGHDVGDAFEIFAEGDMALNVEEYKGAFGFYREAYREAVGQGTATHEGGKP